MRPSEATTPAPAAQITPPDRFRAGTLQYTRRTLILVFFWLLWGDFCFQLMELVMPKLMPLQLEAAGASNRIIGALVTSLPAGMNFVINPLISVRSDRHRSRLGRRIPFLLILSPLVAFFLVLLGFAPEISQKLHGLLSPIFSDLSPTTMLLATMGLLIVCFQFFNLMMSPIYGYLFNDVVPPAFLGRFAGLNNTVALGAGALFNYYLFGLSKTHMREIYLGAALLYLVVFMMMCWRVKEGQYPPPPQTPQQGLDDKVASYFRDCFTRRFYIYLFLSQAFIALSTSAGTFAVFFYTKTLGMTRDEFGHIGAWIMFLGMLLSYPFGVLADRLHPVRLNLFSLPLLITAGLLQFFLIHDIRTAWILTLLGDVMGRAYWCSRVPMWMRVFPKERYGQFASAQGMVLAASTILGGYISGEFLDRLHDYRYVFLWGVGCSSISLIFAILMYRDWIKQGGTSARTAAMA
jgi:MFS family permease